MELTTILMIFWLHFVADFVMQSDKMAHNKSTNSKWLLFHITVYSLFFIVISPLYALVNGILHFMVDYVSSRVASHYHKKNQIHNFFVVVGFDQALHYTALFSTYVYFSNNGLLA